MKNCEENITNKQTNKRGISARTCDATHQLACMVYCTQMLHTSFVIYYVTGLRRHSLTYTKYACSCYGPYLIFSMCYTKSVSSIEFLMESYIYNEMLITILSKYKRL